MENKRLYVDIHVLQTVPPSCINRDDTGSPKTAVYGGTMRARVSSQSWKHAMRLAFQDIFPKGELALRTKRVHQLLSEEIAVLAPDADAAKLAGAVMETAELKTKGDDKLMDALFFISEAQLKDLAELAVNDPEVTAAKPAKGVKDRVLDALRQNPGVDIALFGRMAASDPTLNTDACAQVAHAISTHRVDNEYDYFTAVDDASPADNAGAAHIGTKEYNSATLYRYATVAVHQLEKYLGDDTMDALAGFIDAFVRAMPTGSQNTFANRTLPEAVYVAVRTDQPVNLAGAFEKPVYDSEEGYMDKSAQRLAEKAKEVYEDYAAVPAADFATGRRMKELAETMPFDQLLESVKQDVRARL